jgi:hypothetical protein
MTSIGAIKICFMSKFLWSPPEVLRPDRNKVSLTKIKAKICEDAIVCGKLRYAGVPEQSSRYFSRRPFRAHPKGGASSITCGTDVHTDGDRYHKVVSSRSPEKGQYRLS